MSSLALRFTGRLSSLDEGSRLRLFNRSVSTDALVVATVRAIIDRVRREGDTALFDLARELDGVVLERLEIPKDVVQASLSAMPPELKTAMLRSARNIEAVHAASRPVEISVDVEAGVIVSRRPDPLARVGVYAPGGTAAYASSVLMAAVPARVAGVGEVILCSPPSPSGLPAPEILAAAAIAGVERVFTLGGAGAIAAMALGTETVPRVDKVVGPGNAFVAEAKLQLVSEVAIDCPAGPSELVIIADDSATPEVIAREVMAQAEHDVRAVVLVFAIGESVATNVGAAIECALASQPRQETVREALRNRGGILVVDTEDEAVRASNDFAPEHLLIATRDPERIATSVRATGAMFIGETASVAFGDYMTGANHVLPTGGMGRAYSGLSTLDFIRWTTKQVVSREAAASLSADTARFAEAEGLPAHAFAAQCWGEA